MYRAIDSHAEGMLTRVITGGLPALPGTTMTERRPGFMKDRDGLRCLIMHEPRGNCAMSGVILQRPPRDDADWVVLFIEVSGLLPMCGHGTMGVTTVLVETGMVEVAESTTTIRLNTPAGLVTAQVQVQDGRAESVVITNVSSFSVRQNAQVTGFGAVDYDLACGGNFYAVVDLESLGLPFDRVRKDDLLRAGPDIIAAINAADEPTHPLRSDLRGCHHVYLKASGSDARHSRHAMVIYPGWFDRSPCGTGTSARMVQVHARGELALGQEFINESFIGSRFVGNLTEVTEVSGIPAVIPQGAGL
ncbi:proline racemase family protein [Nesterenkonia muleiensis]|uniref:proline racemase family protein n=1 Tax=Nesterenkonia muleiensis TaxID=2282648 RepID=UPI000E76E0EE|nr:proline racemase family protein [Nesterenkonia muleiensis]